MCERDQMSSNFFICLSKSKRPIVLGISESWLDSSTADGALAIPSFTIHRRDRHNRGGGILVYVSNRFRSRRRCDIEDESIEAVWIELRIKRRVILLGNVYRPPGSDATFMTNLEVMIEKAVSECKLVVLMGDFNVNLLKTSSLVEHLLSITGSNALTHLISKPTRITDQSESLIDALFTSDTSIFHSTGTFSVTGSDHMMIYGEMTIKVPAPVQISTVRSFKKCNVDEMINDLEGAPSQTTDTFDCINDRWDYWKRFFSQLSTNMLR